MPSSGTFVVIVRGRRAEVVRVSRGPNGEVYEESRHVVENGGCDCEAFRFRKTCSHLEAAALPIAGKSVTLDEARAAASAFAGITRLPDEPYERGADGLVSRVRLLARGPACVVKGTVGGVLVEVEVSP